MMEVLNINELINNNKYQLSELEKHAGSVTGIDINKEGVEILKNKGFDVYCLDICGEEHDKLYDEKWDVIILSHVIEHVPDIYNFISASVNKFNFEQMIVAVPNAYHMGNLKNVLRGRENISNDHYYTFTPITIIKLMESFGLQCVGIYSDKNSLEIKGAKSVKSVIKILFRKFENMTFRGLGDLIVIVEKKKL